MGWTLIPSVPASEHGEEHEGFGLICGWYRDGIVMVSIGAMATARDKGKGEGEVCKDFAYGCLMPRGVWHRECIMKEGKEGHWGSIFSGKARMRDWNGM